jgi:hypothetical protein
MNIYYRKKMLGAEIERKMKYTFYAQQIFSRKSHILRELKEIYFYDFATRNSRKLETMIDGIHQNC